ncbi:MAG: coproporphyrinogen dehydrogenase HemZ [Lachnospiraceae bacterium]
MNIGIRLGDFSFQYDAYTLVRAFFPGDNVTVFDAETESGDEYDILIDAAFSQNTVNICLYDKNNFVSCEASEDISGRDRKQIKNSLKRSIYRTLSDKTGRALPWGTLSGIRPVKIPFKLMMNGCSDDEAARYMEENYYVSPAKSALAVKIARTERSAIDSLGIPGNTMEQTDEMIRKGYSLYIGIPFCPSICFYCTFSSGLISEFADRIEKYVSTLIYELESISKMMSGRKLFTVYVGGGTPTVLTAAQLERLLSAVDRYFDTGNVLEYTVEAGRPDTIDKDRLLVLKNHNVTRISINPQTMNDRTLEIIGRKHTSAGIREAFDLAREVGFDNINADIIAGLPSEGKAEISDTLRKIKELGPESLTVHSLAVKRASRYNLNHNQYDRYDYLNNDDIMDMAHTYACEMNMIPYYLYRQKNMKGNLENIGFSKPDKIGLYNILIMEERQSVMAAGAGAISKFVYGSECAAVRAANVKNADEYLKRIDEMIKRKEEEVHWLE